jgi:hypothetical protein
MNGRGAAVNAARRGWAVFPCRPGDKRPAVLDWEHRACREPDRVARYWPSRSHNVGIACGPSGLVVVDLDTIPDDAPGQVETIAPYGAARLAELCSQSGQEWPGTLTVSTPRGGWHLYFRAGPGPEIRNSASKIAPKVDVRAAGGYVIGAGSVVNGRPYQVKDGNTVGHLPPWLAKLASAPRRTPANPRPEPGHDGSAFGRLRGALAVVLSARPGERNNCLHWASCRTTEMVTAGQISESAATAALTQAGEETGLEPGEIQATIASAFRRVMA